MVNAILRTKSIGTKVTEEEYARLDELAAAAGQSRAEWVRTILLDRLEREAAKVTEETVLAELLGLRTILLNLLFTTAKGETMTAEQMQAVIERADAGKLERARKLLASHVAAAPAELPPEMPGRNRVQ
jgi:DNA-binding GntR family transcriptional regulator